MFTLFSSRSFVEMHRTAGNERAAPDAPAVNVYSGRLQPLHWKRTHEKFVLAESRLQPRSIARPPFAVELFDHDFAHDHVVAIDRAPCLLPGALRGRAHVSGQSTEALRELVEDVAAWGSTEVPPELKARVLAIERECSVREFCLTRNYRRPA